MTMGKPALEVSAILGFGSRAFEPALNKFKRIVQPVIDAHQLGGDLLIIYLQFQYGDLGKSAGDGVNINRFSEKSRSISIIVRITEQGWHKIEPGKRDAFLMATAISGLRAVEARLPGKAANNVHALAEALQSLAPQGNALEGFPVSDEPPITGPQSQLILQFTQADLNYDGLIKLEDALIDGLGECAEVDGHDTGSGESNIYILTDHPEQIFRDARKIVETHGIAGMKAAFRRLDEEDYIILWPAGLMEFNVT